MASIRTSLIRPRLEGAIMSTSDNTTSVDIVVPDIGDAENVEVIELLVSVCDAVGLDDSLLTLGKGKGP